MRYLFMMGALLASSQAMAATSRNEIHYGAPAAWVRPSPSPTDGETPADSPVRFIYSDTQVHAGPSGLETYSAYRVRILRPEALQLGHINIVWNPDRGDATVHYVRIIRAGQTIDVLKDSHFQVIQREGALEQSMITGDLTAMLQVPGLQVGDELEIATTIRSHDPTLGDHVFGLFQLPSQGMPGAFRFRLSWPDAKRLSFKGSRDLAATVPAQEGAEKAITYELRDPRASILNDGAPTRFNIRRLIEYTDFADWADVSSRVWPLFANAATLSPKSPLRERISQIEAASSDPATRAMAALKLVQDEVRYVYVGLNDGNFRPASIDETWSRRFGDCKAKTVMLLALLHAMNIEAEPVLVNAQGGDGLDGRLPSAGVFDHVLVRAKIAGKDYWLDGTRLGDRYMDMLPQPDFRWGLPLRQAGGTLEAIQSTPFARPQFIAVLDMDASAGFTQPAKISVKNVIRGDEAYAIRSRLAGLSTEDADRMLRAYWRQEEGWIEASNVGWRYDERNNTAILDLAGTAKPDWTGDDKDGHSNTIWRAGFPPPDILHRPSGQDSSAPWVTDFPEFKCYAATVHLPKSGAKRVWTYDADAMNRQISGTTYWRAAGLKGDIMRVVKSRSVGLREITAEQARAQTDAVPGFNNKMSSVFETAAGGASKPKAGGDSLPFADNVDWAADDSACIAVPQAKP